MTISVDDVIALLGRDPTGDEENRINRLIGFAEAAVETELPGFSYAAGNETVDIPWNDPDVLWTPRYPVTAVNAITVDQADVDPTTVRWGVNGKIEPLYAFGTWVVNRPAVVGWVNVTVDYDYGLFGLSPVPNDMVALAAGMVASVIRRQAINPGNVVSESIGSYSVTYDRNNAPVDMVVPPVPKRWKRNAMLSVPLVRHR